MSGAAAALLLRHQLHRDQQQDVDREAEDGTELRLDEGEDAGDDSVKGIFQRADQLLFGAWLVLLGLWASRDLSDT